MEANIVGRSDEFIRAVNKKISDPEFRMPYGEPDAAFALVSMVAAHYWDDEKNQAFVNMAFEAAVHLEGASIKELAIDPRMVHITDKRKYGAGVRKTSIDTVAGIAAALVEIPDVAELDVSQQAAAELHEEIFEAPKDLREAVIRLLERGRISRQFAEGLLVVGGVVDTTELNPKAVRRVEHLTRHLLHAKVEKSFAKTSYPTISSLTGNTENGVAGMSVEKLITEATRQTGDPEKGKSFVLSNLARELTQLLY